MEPFNDDEIPPGTLKARVRTASFLIAHKPEGWRRQLRYVASDLEKHKISEKLALQSLMDLYQDLRQTEASCSQIGDPEIRQVIQSDLTAMTEELFQLAEEHNVPMQIICVHKVGKSPPQRSDPESMQLLSKAIADV